MGMLLTHTEDFSREPDWVRRAYEVSHTRRIDASVHRFGRHLDGGTVLVQLQYSYKYKGDATRGRSCEDSKRVIMEIRDPIVDRLSLRRPRPCFACIVPLSITPIRLGD